MHTLMIIKRIGVVLQHVVMGLVLFLVGSGSAAAAMKKSCNLHMPKVLIVWGISSSGKTTLVEKLVERIGKDLFAASFARCAGDDFDDKEIDEMAVSLEKKKYRGALEPEHFLALNAVDEALQKKRNVVCDIVFESDEQYRDFMKKLVQCYSERFGKNMEYALEHVQSMQMCVELEDLAENLKTRPDGRNVYNTFVQFSRSYVVSPTLCAASPMLRGRRRLSSDLSIGSLPPAFAEAVLSTSVASSSSIEAFASIPLSSPTSRTFVSSSSSPKLPVCSPSSAASEQQFSFRPIGESKNMEKEVACSAKSIAGRVTPDQKLQGRIGSLLSQSLHIDENAEVATMPKASGTLGNFGMSDQERERAIAVAMNFFAQSA